MDIWTENFQIADFSFFMSMQMLVNIIRGGVLCDRYHIKHISHMHIRYGMT